MIVTCSQCDTQFRLDDSKVGTEGLRVRCSLCKHAFFVEPPAGIAPSDEPPADPEAETAPELSRPEDDGAIDGDAMADIGTADGLIDDGDWEFNEEQSPDDRTLVGSPPDASESGRDLAAAAVDDLLGPGPAGDVVALSPATAPGTEELGSPENWDFFSGGSSSAPPTGLSVGEEPESEPALEPPDLASELEPADLASEPAPLDLASEPAPELPDPLVEQGEEAGAAPLLDAPAPFTEVPELPRTSIWLGRVSQALAWTAVAALLLAGLYGGLAPRASARLPSTGVGSVGGLEVQVDRARFVENAVAGPLFVVSGRLRNPGDGNAVPGHRHGVRLVDGQGRALSVAPAPLGPPLAEEELREWDPRRLAENQARGAELLSRVPLRPGERWLFDAVIARIPAAARGFTFEVGREPTTEAFRP